MTWSKCSTLTMLIQNTEIRFLWFEDCDPIKEITEYRITVHLFGNGPSPAIATFGLKMTVNHGEDKG